MQHALIYHWDFESPRDLNQFKRELCQRPQQAGTVGNFFVSNAGEHLDLTLTYHARRAYHRLEFARSPHPRASAKIDPFAPDIVRWKSRDGLPNTKEGRNIGAARLIAEAIDAIARRHGGSRVEVNDGSYREHLRYLARRNVCVAQDRRRDALVGPITAPGGWAVVLVDMQPEFIQEALNKGMSVARSERVIPPMVNFLRMLWPLNVPVAVVEYFDSGRTRPELMHTIDGHLPWIRVVKNQPSAFGNSRISTVLQGWNAKRLILMGANRGSCLVSTTRDANAAGYEVHLVERLTEDYNYASSAEARREASDAEARNYFRQHCRTYPDTRSLAEYIKSTIATA